MATSRRRSNRSTVVLTQYAEESDHEESDRDMEDEDDHFKPQEVIPKAQNQPAQPKGRQRKRKATEKEVADASLLDIVIKYSDSIPIAAKEWVNRYRENKIAATAEVLSFLVQAGGSDMVLTAEEVEEGEVDRLVETLITSVTLDGYVDFFKAKGIRNFRDHYLEMWDHLFREAQAANCLLQDEYLLDKLSHLLIGLNCSVVRSLRYVATLTQTQVVTSLIRAMLGLVDARETAVRQKEAEERKKGGLERAQAFQKTVTACQRQVQVAKDAIAGLFRAVTSHRFRDVAEDIRAVVITGVGAWIKLHPAEFLQDNYLKYLAWALSDKDALVREAAVDALLGLYAVKDNLSPLHGFTERFKTRFCELIYDVNDAVAIKGVQLVTSLVKLEEVEPEAVREVYRLLVDSAAGIRHAAAGLVAGLLEEQGARFLLSQQPKTPEKGSQKRRKKAPSSPGNPSKKDLQLAGVLHIMHLLGNDAAMGAVPAGKITDAAGPLDPVLVSMVVDALSDGHRVEILEDWRALVEALMDDASCEMRGAAATTNLAFLLCESLARACAAAAGPKAGTARAKSSAAAAAAARQDATLALLKPLPRLLRKFQTESATVAPLASLVRNLRLEVYSLKREEKEVEALLELLSDLVVKLRHPGAIKECLASLHYCASEGPDPLKEKGQAAWRQLGLNIAKKAKEAVDELLALSDSDLTEAAGEEEEEACEEAHAAWAAMLRVHYYLLSCPFPPAAASVSKTIDSVLQDAAKGRDVPTAVLEQAVMAKHFLLLWALKAAEESGAASPSASSPSPSSAAGEVGRSVRAFAEQLDMLLTNSESNRVRDAAFAVLCELMLVFDSKKLRAVGMQEAGLSPSDSQVENLWAACEDILGRDASAEADDGDLGEAAAAAAARIVDAQVKALTAATRLVVFQALPHWEDVAAGVLSHVAGHDKRVCDVAKDLHRRLKAGHSARVPVFFLAALQVAYLRTQAADFTETAMEQFLEVCVRIAALQSPPAPVPPGTLQSLLLRGLDFVLQDMQGRLPCCEGLALMVPRLSPDDADAVLKKAQEHVAVVREGGDDRGRDAFQSLVSALQDRFSKSRAGQGTWVATPASAPARRRGKKKKEAAVRTGRNSDSEASDAEEIEDADEAEEATPRDGEGNGEVGRQQVALDQGWKSRRSGARAAAGVAGPSSAPKAASRKRVIERVYGDEEEEEEDQIEDQLQDADLLEQSEPFYDMGIAPEDSQTTGAPLRTKRRR